MSVVWLYIANVWAVYGLVVGISWQIPRPWHCCTWLSWLLCSGGYDYTRTHTQPFNGPWSGTTWVGRYQKKHSPTHIHPDHRTSFINFLHLLHSIASSLFSLRARQSSLTTSVQVHIGLPLGLGPSTSYSMHFFAQSSSFRSTCPYHRSLFLVIPMLCHLYLVSLSLSSLLGNLSFSLISHIHLTILISARWSATTFSFLAGQVSLPCNMLLRTQLLYNLPLIINDTSLLVSSGTNCLKLFLPIRILASTAASASPFTRSMSPR